MLEAMPRFPWLAGGEAGERGLVDVAVDTFHVRVAVVEFVVLELPHPGTGAEDVAAVGEEPVDGAAAGEGAVVGVVHDAGCRGEERVHEHDGAQDATEDADRRQNEPVVADDVEADDEGRLAVEAAAPDGQLGRRREDLGDQAVRRHDRDGRGRDESLSGQSHGCSFGRSGGCRPTVPQGRLRLPAPNSSTEWASPLSHSRPLASVRQHAVL